MVCAGTNKGVDAERRVQGVLVRLGRGLGGERRAARRGGVVQRCDAAWGGELRGRPRVWEQTGVKDMCEGM